MGKDMLSRRSFITGAATAGALAALGLTGCSTSKPATSSGDVTTWDKEADVVVCGGGGTGLAAACEASANGASVIVLEKMSSAGGSTRLSGGMVAVGGASYQKDLKGYTGDSPDKQYEYYMAVDAKGGNCIDSALVRDYCDNVLDNLAWLEDKGIKYVNCFGVKPVPGVDISLTEPPRILIPGDAETGVNAAAGTGRLHTDPLLADAEAAGVTFEYDVEVKSLITDETNGIIGVVAENKSGETFTVKALKGVILATGGYDHDLEMARGLSPWHYDSLRTKAMLCISNPGNTGDGHKMGVAVGAALSCMGGTMNTPINTQ
ncbi:MAG: FAD-dependent oxidoreductase, partial [Actinobacteria bacterium]|nr:FAD-dependent oxidoreductase [Actinomycetota bacterium]